MRMFIGVSILVCKTRMHSNMRDKAQGGVRAPPDPKQSRYLANEFVPTDGIRPAIFSSSDFGRSPFLGSYAH